MTDCTPRPKAKRKPKRANATKVCDELFGQIIRSRGACEIDGCGQTWDIQCAHGFSRGYRATRWDERQCFCLCRGHHLYFTHRPIEWDDWMRARLGVELYDEIRDLALHGRNPKLPDVLARLRERARELEIAA